jgi:type 2 lantibiotic biosynthesis protein LanM
MLDLVIPPQPNPATTTLPPTWWAAALTARERRPGAALPAWAGFAEAALSRESVDVQAELSRESSGPHWRTAFAAVFRPFTDAARAAIAGAAAASPAVDATAVADGCAARLGHQLAGLAARTLVLELGRARRAEVLAGETPEERFADFVRQTGTPTGLTDLLHRYPVLARLTAQAALHAIESVTELLDRFAADRAALTAFVGTDPGLLTEISGGTGDAHQRGRSVRELRFAGGARVIYKPRPLDLHAAFTGLVDWLNPRVPGLELRTVDVLVRPGYGWLRFVEHRPCADLTEVDRFYRRQGVLLALLHALDGTDVHFENIIAAGDQPVLIDIETLFQPVLPTDENTAADPDPAAELLARSVHRTMLLPQMIVGEHGAVDISGLGGGRAAAPALTRVDWLDAGTDRMRLTRVPGGVGTGVNRPTLGGVDVEPAEHGAALLAGFRAGYDAIAAGAAEFTARLDRCAGAGIRVLVRPTSFYTRLLDETTHPSLLAEADARDDAFGLLHDDSTDEVRRGLVDAELTDLWAGDVPMFTGRPGSADLWDAEGNRLAGLLGDVVPLKTVRTKVAGMTTIDRRDQEWLISAALATRPAAETHAGTGVTGTVLPSKSPEPAHLLSAACGVADAIIARASSAAGRVNWVGLELVDEKYWTVLPMGAGLGEGYTGVALFLAQLAELTGIDRYRDLAAKALSGLPWLVSALEADPELAAAAGPGGLLGLGGVAYATARLSRLLDRPDLLDLTARTVAVLPAPTPETSPRYTTGLAGGLVALRSVATQTGFAEATLLADAYAAELAVRSLDPDLADPGFAHGAAGVDWALAGYPRETATLPPAKAATGHGWCSGLAGQVLAYAGQPAVLGGLGEQVRVLAAQDPLRDLSLCHGETGITDVLGFLAETGHEDAAAAVATRTGQLLTAVEQDGARCGTPDGVPSPGLLTGLAGIGYGLLRLGFGPRVPSALLLQPPTH